MEIAPNSREPGKKIAENFGISPATLSNWLKADEVETGTREGVTRDQVEELRQSRRRNRRSDQENEVTWPYCETSLK